MYCVSPATFTFSKNGNNSRCPCLWSTLSHSNQLELKRIVIVVRFEPLLSIVKATTSTPSQSQSQQQRRNPTRIISLFCRIRASSLSLSSKPTLVLIYVVQYYIHEERIGRVTIFPFVPFTCLFIHLSLSWLFIHLYLFFLFSLTFVTTNVYLSVYLYSFYSMTFVTTNVFKILYYVIVLFW